MGVARFSFGLALAIVLHGTVALDIAQAQKFVLQMTFDAVPDSVSGPAAPPVPLPNYNLINVEADIKVQSAPVDGFPTDEDVPLLPQKDGVAQPTYHGIDSLYDYLSGTINAVVEFSGGGAGAGGGVPVPTRLQIANSDVIFLNSGEYCPGDGSADGADKNASLRETNGTFDPNEECPYEEPGNGAASIGTDVPGEGEAAVHAVIRNVVLNLNGASDVTGTQINSENWHYAITTADTDVDGTGAVECGGGGQLEICAAHDRTSAPDQVGHNESDMGEIDHSTYFLGTFAGTGNQDEYALSFPAYVPAYFGSGTDTNPDPDEYIRLIVKSLDQFGQKAFLNATGTLSDELIEGDANNDGIVDGLDVNLVSRNYTKGENHNHVENNHEPHDTAHPKYPSFYEGDVNLSSIVDDADFAIVVGNFGATAGAGSGGATNAVPEPSSGLLAVLLAMLMGLAGSRRRR